MNEIEAQGSKKVALPRKKLRKTTPRQRKEKRFRKILFHRNYFEVFGKVSIPNISKKDT